MTPMSDMSDRENYLPLTADSPLLACLGCGLVILDEPACLELHGLLHTHRLDRDWPPQESTVAAPTSAMAVTRGWQQMLAELPSKGVFTAAWDPEAGIHGFLAALDPTGDLARLSQLPQVSVNHSDLEILDSDGYPHLLLRPGDFWTVDLRQVSITGALPDAEAQEWAAKPEPHKGM